MLVLLVDDNPAHLEIAKTLCTAFGWTVEVAANGKEGVDAWRVHRPDVVLMDIEMPEMDGYAATRAIRADEAKQLAPSTPILAITSLDEADTREAREAAGMDGFIGKPLDPSSLHDAVAAVMAIKGR